ncbi:helix-turn-helix domain-containing protein [Sporosarcina newyorkensis]|uniref:helix-turn-helix domain-containing protein n=1 Tax=Sporosarcina newyorkensis TaxID=759851 RepID=UPI003D039AAB
MEKITLTVNEVAALIGVGMTTIYTMVRQEEIPHKKVRGRILFHRGTIEKWLSGEESESKIG